MCAKWLLFSVDLPLNDHVLTERRSIAVLTIDIMKFELYAVAIAPVRQNKGSGFTILFWHLP